MATLVVIVVVTIAGKASADPVANLRSVSNVELSIILSSRQNSEYIRSAWREAGRRKLFTGAEVSRIRGKRGSVRIGDSAFSVLASRGMPTHFNSARTNEGTIHSFYYYKDALLLEALSVAFIRAGRVSGFAQAITGGVTFPQH